MIDGDCVCGYHEHIYVNGYDEDSHYKECSCGDIINDTLHDLVDGECDCGYVDPSYVPPTGDGDEGGEITPPPSGDGEGGSNDGEVDTDIEQQPSTDNNTPSNAITCVMAVNGNGLIDLTLILSAMILAFIVIKISRRKSDERL